MITPADSPSSPENYAGVAVQPMDIQAGQDDLSAVTAAAVALTGPGGPRQSAAGSLLSSPQGYADFDITAGYSGGGGEDWPGDISP